jgi:hypothetical protein
MTTDAAVQFFDATISYPVDNATVPVRRARFTDVDGKRAFLAEWREDDLEWSMRLLTTDGVKFHGVMAVRGEAPIETEMELWRSADGRRSMLDGVYALEGLVHWQIVLEPMDEGE